MSALDSKYALLVRREFWEHRTLWLAPAVVALLIVILPLFGNFSFGRGGGLTVSQPDMPPAMLSYFSTVLLVGLAGVLGVVAGIVSLVYLLDCLFAERRDRSILFWKSLPVSDAQTVLTKLGVALVLMPLLTLVLVLLAYCLLAGLLSLRYEHLRGAFGLANFGRGLTLVPQLAASWAYFALWFAPVAAWLMLASVFAKRAPLVYAVLPPVVLSLLERLLLDSSHIDRFIASRLRPEMPVIPRLDPTNPLLSPAGPDWIRQLGDPDLWLGLAAAAVMVYIVIRVRRYRDDT